MESIPGAGIPIISPVSRQPAPSEAAAPQPSVQYFRGAAERRRALFTKQEERLLKEREWNRDNRTTQSVKLIEIVFLTYFQYDYSPS